jgi:hypothetical protein
MSARGSAVRNARTAVTSAENKGRMDMLHDAEEKGVKAEKGWLAAHDARVRESHAQVDGEFVGIDKEFSNGLQFPGDPDGRPEEVYNCRCTLVYKVVGFGKKAAENISDDQIGKIFDADDIVSANADGTEILGGIYDRHSKENGLRRVQFSDANKLTQIVGADYGNLSPEVANVFNRQISRLASEYDTPLQKVRIMKKQEAVMSQNTFARVTHNYAVDSAEMAINPVKCRDFSELAKRITELQEKGYCVKVQAGKEAEYIVTHEFAHSIIDMGGSLSQNFVNADFKVIKKARSEIEAIYTDYIKEVLRIESEFKKAEFDFIMGNSNGEAAASLKKELDKIKLSNYSMLNADEFLAESFTSVQIGTGSNSYAEKVVEVLKKYFGR